MKKYTLVLLAFLPTLLWAHPGHALLQSAWLSGVLHPLTGLDHLAMAVGFGLLLAKSQLSQQLSVWLMLSVGLLAGFIFGASHMLAPYLVEVGIAGSIILVSGLLYANVRQWVLPMVLLVSTLHGTAHGLEVTAATPHVFAIGMLLGMSVLYGCGMLIGRRLSLRRLKLSAPIVGILGLMGVA